MKRINQNEYVTRTDNAKYQLLKSVKQEVGKSGKEVVTPVWRLGVDTGNNTYAELMTFPKYKDGVAEIERLQILDKEEGTVVVLDTPEVLEEYDTQNKSETSEPDSEVSDTAEPAEESESSQIKIAKNGQPYDIVARKFLRKDDPRVVEYFASVTAGS